MELKVNALMLRAVDYRENDKILTLLTPDHGKLTAGIKGVKKAGAKLKFASQPFCFAEYLLAEKGGKYTVVGASEVESFYDLRTDIQKFYAGATVMEVANAFCYEGQDGGVLFPLCVRALSQICTEDTSSTLIAFLLQASRQAGYALHMGDCIVCQNSLLTSDKMRLDADAGAFTCWDCGTGLGTSGTTYHTLRKMAGLSYDPAYLSADGERRALRLLKEFLTYKTDDQFLALSEYLRLL